VTRPRLPGEVVVELSALARHVAQTPSAVGRGLEELRGARLLDRETVQVADGPRRAWRQRLVSELPSGESRRWERVVMSRRELSPEARDLGLAIGALMRNGRAP
jgi:hypothetical protein